MVTQHALTHGLRRIDDSCQYSLLFGRAIFHRSLMLHNTMPSQGVPTSHGICRIFHTGLAGIGNIICHEMLFRLHEDWIRAEDKL